MASICTDRKSGTRRIVFKLENERKAIRLGACSKNDALTVKRHVENLVNAIGLGQQPPADTLQWLATIGDTLHDRVVRAGLTSPRVVAPPPVAHPLGAVIDSYTASRIDLKPGTLLVLKQGRDALVGFFGENRPMESIFAGDADLWRLDQLKQGYADATVRKRVTTAKQIFSRAMRSKIIEVNPFADLPSATRGNAARQRFISPAVADQVIAACPDAQWRLIFALSRYAGLRCPSEHLALQWGDVDWERGRFTVHSSKTERHEGKATRAVPIFPELMPYLRECFEEAEPGDKYVITRYRTSNCNLRTQLHRIIRKAGIEPWPKLFHNLRATRETELAETFPEHVVCKWIGNSAVVARKHYMQVTDEHFERASGEAARETARKAHVVNRKPTHDDDTTNDDNQLLLAFASDCGTLHNPKLGAAGFEPATEGL